MMTILRIVVFGVPAPGGSKKAFVNPRTGRAVIVDDAKRNKPWRESVLWAAREAMQRQGWRKADGCPLRVEAVFSMPRPKGHYGTGRNVGQVRESAPRVPMTKPDATKLWRAAEDALTDSGVWGDDAQVVEQLVTKRYVLRGEQPGVSIRVCRED